MAVDRYGNTIVKKDFLADGVWYVVFLLIPVALIWAFVTLLLVYGAYFTFRYDIEHLKAGFFFLLFAFFGGVALAALVKSVYSLLIERVVFTPDRIIYRGFGSYVAPYQAIKRVMIRDRRGPFGQERLLALVATDQEGHERFYVIPRWKSLSGGVLVEILSKHVTLTLLDRGLLSYYVAFHGREWWFTTTLAGVAVFFLVSFFAVRSSPQTLSSITVFFWFVLVGGLIIFLARYLNRKKEMMFAA